MAARRLLFSIHDVAPAFRDEVERLVELAAPTVGRRLAMLVVPAHWNSAPLVRGTPFATQLRGWADQGIEMFVHGWTHRDDSVHADPKARFRAARMTAGEGEFLGLDHAEAGRRLAAGRALIEDIIGRPTAGFIAPAWLYGEGARAALTEAGTPLAEDHLRVWSPRTGKVLSRGPVMTWASRTPARLRSSLALGLAMRHLPMPPTMRVAVHPPDIRVPALRTSVASTLAALGRSRSPAAYGDLLI